MASREYIVHAHPGRVVTLTEAPRCSCTVDKSQCPDAATGPDGLCDRCRQTCQRPGATRPEEPDNAEARAYLDAIRVVAHWLEVDDCSPAGRAVILADLRRVVAIHGRTLALGGALEGRA